MNIQDIEIDTDIIFDYLDWCKEKGLSFEETKDLNYAKEFGHEQHRQGVEINYGQLLLMTGRANELFDIPKSNLESEAQNMAQASESLSKVPFDKEMSKDKGEK